MSNTKEIDDYIKRFTKRFENKFGVLPIVFIEYTSVIGHSGLKISLKNLEDIVNHVLKARFGEDLNIRDKNRLEYTVCMRDLYFKFGRSMNYTYQSIGQSILFNHATVMHGIRTIKDRLETKEIKILILNNIIANEINRRYGYIRDTSGNNKA